MGIELNRPLALLLIPAFSLFVFLIGRKYGIRGLKGKISYWTRYLLVVLLGLALCAPTISWETGEGATWVLTDGSASTRGSTEQMAAALRAGLQSAPSDMKTGIIAFGEEASVVAPLAFEHRMRAGEAGVGASRLSEALNLAGALLPPDASGRVLVLSDGRTDDISEEAAMLSARGIPVDVMRFDQAMQPDAQVSEITLPGSLRAGQSLEINARVDANYETKATLLLYANRQLVSTRAVLLRKGENHFVFQDVLKTSGVVTYEAQLIAEGDQRPQNDRKAAYVRVDGRARVLVVEGKSGIAREFLKMLRAAGLDAEKIAPSGLPNTAEGFLQYDAIALQNVDEADLTDAQIAALSDAVKKLGRGLTVIGGDQSYALGGYRGGALEDMLPVTMDVKNRLQLPALALMLVIDKSGSMTEGRYGTTRLELAKEAAIRATEVLTDFDSVGVIAFDDAAQWVVLLQKAEDLKAIQAAIGTIRPAGGTAYTAALQGAFEALSSSPAPQRHIIFLTDGEPGDGGFEPMIHQMAQSGITLTTVAVGGGANATLLRDMAAAGGGRAYIAGEFDNLPKIFAKETFLVSGAYVQNRVFTPVMTERSLLTDYEGLPQMAGYLATTARPTAQVAWVSDRNDPIVAHWQYGAGKVLCFTSDAEGVWTEAYLRWEKAPEFYSGLLSFVLPAKTQEGDLTAEISAGEMYLSYEAPEGAGGVATEAEVLKPDGNAQRVKLNENAPGVYEARLQAQDVGAYAIRVWQTKDSKNLRAVESGAINAYPEEYDLRAQAAGSTLEKLASDTGGRVLTDASQMFSLRGKPARKRTDIKNTLLILTLIVLLLDVAQRRLSWERAIVGAKNRLETRKSARPIRPRVKKPPKKTEEIKDTAELLLAQKRDRRKL